jgi:glycerol-3-phosphate cytidylyltransferase|tara:strand:+ start:302 stop:688 length:387 start_codon:yes stop_codon:yes gene_type:complete
MLREAKSACDYLIVALQNDPSVDRPEKNSPVQNIVERQAQLAAIKYVDEILVYNTEQELLDILGMYQIDVKIMGEEYRDKEFTGKDLCRQRDIEFYFNRRDHRFSTTGLRERIVEREKIKSKSSVQFN